MSEILLSPRPALHAEPCDSRYALLRRLQAFDLLILALVGLADVQVLWTWGTNWGFYDSDWLVFFRAAQRLQHGQQVYTVVDQFFNPPQFLLLVRALLPFGYLPSRLLWCLCSALMLAVAVLAMARMVGLRLSVPGQILAVLCALLYTPTMLLIPTASNSSAPVVLSYALGMLLLTQGRDGLAGAVLSCTLVKPQLALLILPLLVYKGRWRAAGSYLTVTAVSSLLAYLLVGRDTFVGFLQIQRVTAQAAGKEGLWLRDIPGLHAMFLQWWPQSTPAGDLAYLLSMLLLGGLAWYWRGAWQPRSLRFQAGWGMLVLADLLVAPYAHSDDLVLLIIPAVVLVGLLVRPERPASYAVRWIRPALLGLYLAPVLVVYYRQHFMVPALLAAFLLLWLLSSPRAAQRAEDRQLSPLSPSSAALTPSS